MIKEIFAVLFISLLLLPVSTADYCNRYGVNGCNIPSYAPPAYKSRFTSSCYRHDVCYFCAQTKNQGRFTCDYLFYRHMIRKCRWWEFYCKFAAFLYYKAARVGGASHFNSVSPYWCSQSWVNYCIW